MSIKYFQVVLFFLLLMNLASCKGENSISISSVEFDDLNPIAENIDFVANDSTQTNFQNESNPSILKLLIDNFEDGDNQSPLGDYWYTYNDSGSGAESEIESYTIDSEGHPQATQTDNGSKYSFNVKYTLKQGEYIYDPYVGWGVHLPKDDYSIYNAVSYKYKGGRHYIHIEISDIIDSDHYMKLLPASNEWNTVTVQFDELNQEGWGKSVDFNATNITAISFQAKGSDTQDSVFIDDIYFLATTPSK